MGSIPLRARVIRAALCEVERGLFHVSYRAATADWSKHALPVYQTGTSASEVQRLIEQRAVGCGFEMIIWDNQRPIPASLPVALDDTAAAAAD
jgi:hypothetical protein